MGVTGKGHSPLRTIVASVRELWRAEKGYPTDSGNDRRLAAQPNGCAGREPLLYCAPRATVPARGSRR